MGQPLSPLVSLATSMHSQPGVYAVLLGSGVSTGAGLLTGWGVVTELVSRVAAASGADEAGIAAARADPEAWWTENGEGELGYSALLEQLAPSPAARQGLLAGFFEPATGDDDEPVRQPSRAHHAIAQLVRRGAVRVIVTTNFDRLMEQALEAIGVSPQVIARPEAVNGMAPLAHAPATIIKLHGDYRDLGSRNTPSELSEYPDEWKRLLRQVFDEYGLVISGWSADWDHALVAALEDAPSRRYPLYWDQRSSRGEAARRVLAARDGRVLPASSADELFGELVESVDALDRLSAPPLTTAMAIARLKRYLPDPVRRIDLYDLVMSTVDEVVKYVTAQPVTVEGGSVSWEVLDATYSGHEATMEKLAPLLVAGVWHDDGTHDALWVDVMQRLVDAGATFPQTFAPVLRAARLIPAFLALAVISITATRRGREGLLLKIAAEVEAPVHVGFDQRQNVAQVLHYGRLIENEDYVNNLPRWNGQRWTYPTSHLFMTVLRPYLANSFPADDDYLKAFRGFEYRLGLIQQLTEGVRAISGEYVGEWAWRGQEPVAEIELRKVIERGRGTAWETFFGARDLEVDAALLAHREVIAKYQRW